MKQNILCELFLQSCNYHPGISVWGHIFSSSRSDVVVYIDMSFYNWKSQRVIFYSFINQLIANNAFTVFKFLGHCTATIQI